MKNAKNSAFLITQNIEKTESFPIALNYFTMSLPAQERNSARNLEKICVVIQKTTLKKRWSQSICNRACLTATFPSRVRA